ncbi:MAG: T9SS type A sorting domain-containing protein, partial [Bacteroidales bacterium]|nr:T9SS type A sorting domain-containing protein [Bacteroidales bacterium]
GEDLQLVGLGSPDLFRTNNSYYLGYPFTIDNIVSITGSSASSDPTSYYYYFYDWEIELPGCLNEPTILNINAIDCSTNIADESFKNINIYPNPANNILHISGLSEIREDVKLEFIDISGRKVLTKTINEDTSFDIQSLPSGIYFINVLHDSLISTFKIVKY